LAVTAAGCSDSSRPSQPRRSPASRPAPPPAAAAATFDEQLRSRAISDERRLLAACAALPGQERREPFATLRRLHQAHLRVLTAQAAPSPAAGRGPLASAPLAVAERQAAAARRADCVRASPALAPLLASLAASGNVAALLLAP
jgi:hypothetical protein